MTCTVFLPGSGGGFPDVTQLKVAPDDDTPFEKINYPGWKRYVDPKFRPELLVTELAAEIGSRVPSGPLRIVGISMGGHFGYLIALYLQAQGREIEGLCAIDSFIVTTAAPTPGWKSRALAEFLETLKGRRFDDLHIMCRSKLWRAALRGVGDMLPTLLRKAYGQDWLVRALELDPILKRELDIRMMARECAPWLAKIDEEPVPLSTQTALLRTRSHMASDAMWRARCPNLAVYEVEGSHETLFEAENVGCLRDAFVRASRDWTHSTSNA
ncbi:thioesterase domain-containing protein [Bradyrhizobium sp. F1.4.3]|uniref:thioesterase domain-containing protein n=1 Tax=Bradyrhizobium sp. F1.4.3 TaxID=3156356 RepID=UPI0033907D46